jgi:hypothetical protein
VEPELSEKVEETVEKAATELARFGGKAINEIIANQVDVSTVPPPEEPAAEKVPGLSDYKNMMRQFFTVRRQRVAECGHRYNEMTQPRNNCEHCWFAFLNTHGDMVKIADEIFVKENGKAYLTQLQGAKFVKMFCRFMSTIARWKAENDERKSIQEPSGVGEDTRRDEGVDQRVDSVGEEIKRET